MIFESRIFDSLLYKYLSGSKQIIKKMTIDQNITQTDLMQTLATYASKLNVQANLEHYESNAEYYWKNKGQFISVINKGIPDDKLKIIFQTHILKISPTQTAVEDLVYPPMKIIPTQKYSIYVWV